MKLLTRAADQGFYPLAFVVWAMLMFALHGNYNYFGSPFPNAAFSDAAFQSSGIDAIQSSMALLKQSFARETDLHERAHIQENIGIAYYALYKSTKNGAFLDSSEYCMKRSLQVLTDVARFYYNLARIYTEKKAFADAKALYEKTIELDPKHFMAFHNLGLLSYYELKNLDMARTYFQKAIEIDSNLPIDNYMLAEISLDKKNDAAAVGYYEKEIGIYMSGVYKRQLNLADQSSIQLGATLSAMQLAFLYSTTFKNLQLAQDRFNLYLKLETDPQRRQTSLAEIQKFWAVTGNKQTPQSLTKKEK